MAYRFDEKAVIVAYNRLDPEQKERFFPGQEEEAKKIVGSLAYLLGSNCKYDQLLELFITAAVRVMMGFENERVNITVKMRFSDIVPQEKALTVIECIRRIVNNHAFIDGLDSPEIKAHERFFDSQNQDSFRRNEKRLNDAADHPGFGTTMENPIFAHSAAGSYSYLNLLYTSDGVPVTWNRIGSMSPRSGDPLDKYELLLPDGTVFLIVYVNMYSRKRSVYCPCGMMGKGLKEAPRFSEPEPVDDDVSTDYDDYEDSEEESEADEYQAFLKAYSKDNPSSKNEKPRKQKDQSDKKAEERKPAQEQKKQEPEPEVKAEKLYESRANVLQGNLPVLVENCVLSKKANGELFSICTFRSITEKSIRAMLVNIDCYDVWNNKVQSIQGFEYNDIKTQRNGKFGNNSTISIPDSNTRRIEFIVQKVMLANGTLLQRDGDSIEVPEPVGIELDLASTDLAEEYRERTYKDAKYVPVKLGSYWRCTCGEINSNSETNCHRCKKDPVVLFSYYDKKNLQESLEERRRLQKEKQEKERLAREEEQRAREQKEAEEARAHAEKKRKRNKRITICCIIAVVAALAVYLVVWQIIPSNKYKEADAFLKSGDRDAAYSAFLELGSFKDSADRAAMIKYEDGNAALEAGDYDKASELFALIPDYNDSQTKAKEAVYLKAKRLMDEKSYTEAAELFDSVKEYQDSEQQALFCRNEQTFIDATNLLGKKQYKEAGDLFETINSYRDSDDLMAQAFYLYAKELIEEEKPHDAYLILSTKVNHNNNVYEDSVDLANTIEYQYASDCFAEKKYADAAESFGNLKDYQDSEMRCKESQYQHGLEMINNGLYDRAEKQFAELGDYKDSAAQINESVYRHGVALLESEKYDDAIEILSQLTNYRDCATKLSEAKYQKALELLEKKKFNEAETIFTELGYYRDSQAQLSETKYQRAKELTREKKFKQAVELFKELGYYSDSVEQWKSAMYSYVLANKNNNDKTTYDYLKTLRQFNYKDSSSIYENLYKWKASIVINNSKTDDSTKKTSLSRNDTIYCHFTLSGGTPGETVALNAVGYWPWGSSSTVNWEIENKWRRGESGWCSWEMNNPADNRGKGTFTFKLFVGSTIIGEASIKLT